jgi:hypothetical protein
MTLRQVFICLRPRIAYPPSLHAVLVYTVYLFTQGRGDGGELIREQVRRATIHKAGSKIPT